MTRDLAFKLRDILLLTPLVEILDSDQFPREIGKPKRVIDNRVK
ncbi:hypothetical protein KAX03_02250 [Candidatus Bathyarchaeota archaeon]|nr:hypothetical protein [Candidatus Bathyarchaeota archaeon]